jgi:hypothetical protein
MQYCTYLTLYRGNKLPPFYIGYTSIAKIERGYRGTVTSKQYKLIWKQELRDNPNLFKTVIISNHDSKEQAKQRETELQSYFSVHTNPMYINKIISGALLFAPGHSEATKQKIRLTKLGSKNPFYGKTHSEKVRSNISNSAKNKSDKHRTKLSAKIKLLNANKRKSITDGYTTFDSVNECAKYYNIHRRSVLRKVHAGQFRYL